MSHLMEHQNCAPDFYAQFNRGNCSLQKGQRVVYENEEAEVIREKPLLVIKTKSRVICGALQKWLKY